MTATETDKITIAMFKDKADNQPKTSTISWGKLAERLTRHEEREDKDGPLFSPVTYFSGATRGNNGVVSINLAVGDFDHGEDWATVKEQLQVYEYVAYSTHSFTPDDCRFRVVIPLVNPIEKKDWPNAKARIDYHVFRQKADPNAKDQARIYYLPSCPPCGLRFAERHEGKWLDPLSLPSTPASYHIPKNNASPDHAEPTEGMKVPLGKTALDFVANGAPLGEQRSRALAAARNYLSAGYSIDGTAAAIWRGLQSSPQDADRGPWEYEDAEKIAISLSQSEAPDLDMIATPMPPRSEIHRTGMGYVFSFPSVGINIGVDHILRRSDGLKGEITIEALIPGVPRILHWGTFNLSSGTTRNSMAKYLAERCDGSSLNDDKHWKSLLEDFCRKVAFAEREGEPPVRIGDLSEDDTRTWMVNNVVLKNEIGTIYGPGSTGKSRFGLAIGLSVMTGHEIIPGFLPTETGEFYYLDWETDKDRINRRIRQLCRGKGIPFSKPLYLRCKASLVDMHERLIRDVEKYGVKFVLVDSVEAATAGTREGGADQNAAVMLLYEALRRLNTTVLLIDHVNSSQAAVTKGVRKPYGSIFKFNYARYAFELRQAREENTPGEEHLALFCTKYNDGIKPPDVGLRVTFSETETRYRREDIRASELMAGLTQPQQIQRVLEDGPLSTAEIAELTGISQDKVRVIMNRSKKLFVRIANEKWGNLSPM